ncbi:MAG: GtrA family protein [Bryobacteraceae bacterium]|jgi:putative flippase GtrA
MRWLKFNTVGVGGAGVQLCVLWMLQHFTSISYVFAIVLAVEIAILHNFFWHEVWTWRGKPAADRWWRLMRFHLGNGVMSIVSNVALTYIYKEFAGLPLLAANLAAIITAALLNFWVAHAWVFRGVVFFVLCSQLMKGAVITTTLQAPAVVAWNQYIVEFERTPAPSRPLLGIKGDKPTLADLNVNGDVPEGFIHHWIGAVMIPDRKVAAVENVLRDYENYTRIYAPDCKLAEANKIGPQSYDVRLITVRIEPIGLHFAFDMHSKVEYRHEQGDTLVQSRSYLIRESDSGHAPYTDLMPEGNDHGILWRLNSYWRLRQMGTSVYAECQAISLSRRPLFGTVGQVKSRAKESLGFTLRQTKKEAGSR